MGVISPERKQFSFCILFVTMLAKINFQRMLADLAQLVEHRIRNAGVRGSNPLVGTTLQFRGIFCMLML